jgi:hypothetical protein
MRSISIFLEEMMFRINRREIFLWIEAFYLLGYNAHAARWKSPYVSEKHVSSKQQTTMKQMANNLRI